MHPCARVSGFTDRARSVWRGYEIAGLHVRFLTVDRSVDAASFDDQPQRALVEVPRPGGEPAEEPAMVCQSPRDEVHDLSLPLDSALHAEQA